MCGGSDMTVANCESGRSSLLGQHLQEIKLNDVSTTNPNPNPKICNAPTPNPNYNDQYKLGPNPNNPSYIITNANNTTNNNMYSSINAKFMSNSMMKLPPPSQYRSSAVGLAIVAAIQAELDQSPAATSRPSSPPIPIMATSPVPATGHHNCTNKINSSSIKSNSMMINECSSAVNVYHHHKKKPIKKKSFFKPIFSSTLSPDPLSSSPVSAASNGRGDFLRVCFFCKQSLVLSKDIFIYRGDRAFCSTECRYQQIVMDEHKERHVTMSCKGQEYQASKADKYKQKILAAIG